MASIPPRIRPITPQDEAAERIHFTSTTIGTRRACASTKAELGIVVDDDWHHTGIAQRLMEALIKARAHGFRTLEGLVLADNTVVKRL